MVGMVVLAAYRATTRAARDGADELFDTCPAAPATRTAGFLLSAAVPVATLGVFLAVLATAVAFRSPFAARGARRRQRRRCPRCSRPRRRRRRPRSGPRPVGALRARSGGHRRAHRLHRHRRRQRILPPRLEAVGPAVHRPSGELAVTGVRRQGGVLASPVADRPHRRRRHRGRGPSSPGPAGGAGRGGGRRRRAGRRDRGDRPDAGGLGRPDRRSRRQPGTAPGLCGDGRARRGVRLPVPS